MRTQHFQEPDDEPVLRGLPSRYGYDQQPLQTVDPSKLQKVPVLDSRQSYSSSLSSSPGRQAWNTQRGTSTAKPFWCEYGCIRPFGSGRELRRHHETFLHQPALYDASSSESMSQNSLYCVCGKPDRRRDNHQRHVETCERPKVRTFRCNRGHTATYTDKELWLKHLKSPECRPPRGRPPRRTQL